MKVLLFSDNHWCQYSSIVRSRGDKYSTRLEKSLQTMNWIENLSEEKQCDIEVCLGDFFDKAELNAEELTALKDIKWNTKQHIFIVGNHEMGLNNLQFSSAHLFNLVPNSKVIDSPCYDKETEMMFLPYILESERKELSYYIKNYCDNNFPKIILSHNDLAGIQVGKFITKTGFDINEIENSCNIFINGHIHNSERISQNIINIGNVIGQNFSEDSTRYEHHIFIIDTETLELEVIENPFSFNFYKLDVTTTDINKINLKNNSVVTIKCKPEKATEIKEFISNNKYIIESRVILDLSSSSINENYSVDDLSVDHLSRFKQYIVETLGTNEIILDELDKVTI